MTKQVSPPRDYGFRNLDAAKRMHDILKLHATVLTTDELLAGRFVAIRLADGSSDGVAYDTRADAIEHQRNSPSRCAYYRIPPGGWSLQVCDVMLWYVRCAYDNGVREDPAHSLIIPLGREDLINTIEATYGERT